VEVFGVDGVAVGGRGGHRFVGVLGAADFGIEHVARDLVEGDADAVGVVVGSLPLEIDGGGEHRRGHALGADGGRL
jgi:hypothetical protein